MEMDAQAHARLNPCIVAHRSKGPRVFAQLYCVEMEFSMQMRSATMAISLIMMAALNASLTLAGAALVLSAQRSAEMA